MRTYVVASTAAGQLQERVYILVGLLGVMFVMAMLAARLGAARRKRKITKDLASLTGTDMGAKAGRDGQLVTDDWWQTQQAADGGSSQRNNSWQQAILPPGARPIEPPPTPTPSKRTAPTSHRAQPGQVPPYIPPAAAVPAAPSHAGPPPIAARPGSPQPAENPVVAAPVDARSMFDTVDMDNSLGQSWFDSAEKEEEEGR